MEHLEKEIFELQTDKDFEKLALEVFRLQAAENSVYRAYLKHLKLDPSDIDSIQSIPFLPIELFKEHRIITGKRQPEIIFESSGTTGQQSSQHFIISKELYKKSFTETFTEQVGSPAELCILALLPSYLERGNSSLVYMMEHLIAMSEHPDSGFYLDNIEKLSNVLKKRNDDGQPTLLLGVSFALLDLAEKYPLKLEESLTIMETGGMKGRRKEMIRDELHARLKEAFKTDRIRSEYGMTELLSQAYSEGGGSFLPARWMRVFTRDIYDPASIQPPGMRGAVNIIDLANLYSCCFIATGDLGQVYDSGAFEISGRMEQADIRGCNLMVV